MKKVGVIGGGVWGSALAKLLSNNEVLLYARDHKVVNSINNNKISPKLKYVIYNDNVKATNNISDLIKFDYIFVALPSQSIRVVIEKYKGFNKEQKFIIASKGIEIQTNMLLSKVIQGVLKTNNVSILSGPCFSNEVAQNLPTAVTLATTSKKIFEEINFLFNNNNFRLYYSKDIVGCQLGGALKNIYAIASGITSGMNLGDNANSALISRSFAEIIRFGTVLGANHKTLFGLSGLGDLILTCNSLKSRNKSLGHLIASQQTTSIKDHLQNLETTEGYFTVQAVYNISKEKKIDMPITNSIYQILFNNASIDEEISKLLQRPLGEDIS